MGSRGRRYFSAPSGGQEILQLFIDGELQVLARFPNAGWSDKGVFYAVQNWFRSKSPGIHNLSSGEGLLRDHGFCQPGVSGALSIVYAAVLTKIYLLHVAPVPVTKGGLGTPG
jgi:hypothetical protein